MQEAPLEEYETVESETRDMTIANNLVEKIIMACPENLSIEFHNIHFIYEFIYFYIQWLRVVQINRHLGLAP
jgi:hypothetical protein